MYQWRKFEFFEEKYGGKSEIPEEVAGEITCSSSGRGKIVVGCHDGTVSLLDRGLKFNYGFQAHSSSLRFLHHLKWRKFEFFEEKYGGKSEIPEEVAGEITCLSSGRGKIAVGCHNGTVMLGDRGLKFNYD